MKKLCLNTALFTVLSCIGHVAAANDGTISFDGVISDATCVISGGDNRGETASPDFTVKLPQISVTALDGDGKRAGDTPFFIKLSGANCPNGKIASVFFEMAQSTNINATTGNLKNTTATSSGGADKVEIGLLNKDKSVLNLNTANNTPQEVTIASNAARFDYWAQYVATGGASTAGEVKSDVVYSIKYQ